MLSLGWAPVAGAVVVLIVGLTGVGGGALMAPILLLGFGLDLATVVATDLLFATLTKLAVTRVRHKNQFIDWQVTKRLWLGCIPATLLIIWLVQSRNLFASPNWIIQLLGVLVLLSAISLLFGERFQVKQIVVSPGASLSLQKHHHRPEHWVVVAGTAVVQVDDTNQIFTEDQSVYVPIGSSH